MTVTVSPPRADPSPDAPKHRWRVVMLIAAAVVALGGLEAGLALSRRGSSTSPSASSPSYSYYQSMMGRFGPGSMMGGSGNGWMTGPSGYGWMMGGTAAPGWMHGASLPGFMMGASTDAGKVMGQLFADAPGSRVASSDAARLGSEVPAGAAVDRAATRISFSGQRVHLTVLASPAGGPDETFRAAGLVNPTIAVPRGASVTIEFVNADPDTAHGIVVTASGAASSAMPMMSAHPAFSGAALWFLGNPTSAGMHAGTLTFTASTAGTYQYLCPVPGHAQKGMVGAFFVSG